MALRFLRRRIPVLLLWLALLLIAGQTAFGERYLTVEEAQSILFPQATAFEARVIRFTAADQKAIAAEIGEKIRHRGHRVWIARSRDRLHGVMVLDHVLGKHQLIDYAVALSPDGEVLGVEILEYRESYGNEIRQKKWRDQFLGKTKESDLQLHEDIYNISGATISCRNVTEGIRRVLATFAAVIRPRLSDGDGFLPKPSAGRER